MATTLLPPSATDLQNVLAEVDAERLEAIENKIATLWNPWTCPAPFLPWLAWAFSVDVWDSSWTEEKKRAVIAASFTVHRYKGTRKALAAALKALGVDADITEWWEASPEGAPYTFAVEVSTEDSVTPELQAEALAVTLSTKNVRSHLTDLRVVLTQTSRVPLTAAASLIGEDVAVYPWSLEEIVTQSPVPFMAAASYGAEVGTVYPKEAA